MAKKTSKQSAEDTNDVIADAEVDGETSEDMSDAETDDIVDENEGLVKMHKDGEYLHVHPTCVKSHHDAGWKVA